MAWEELAPQVIGRLSSDLKLTPQQAAGIVGQLGHESAGLQAINEYQPTVPGSRGGFGWAQWTGPRRKQFEAFAADRQMEVTDPEANYQYLLHELTNTPESRVLDQLRASPDAQAAGRVFTDQFLRPGVPAYDSRASWTERALNAIIPAAQAGTLPTPDVNSIVWDDAPQNPQIDASSIIWDDAQPATGDPMTINMAHESTPTQAPTTEGAQGSGASGSWEAPPRSFLEETGRQIGLTARAGLQGISALPETLVNPLAKMMGLPEMRISDTLDAVGLPKPENTTERVAQDVAGAMAGLGGLSTAGKLAQGATSQVTQGVGNLLTASPKMQIASTITGSGAASTARESGASQGTQLALGLGGALAPSMVPYSSNTLFRYAMRGGEQSRQAMQNRIQQFQDATGEMPTYGQATGRSIAQGAENIATKTLGSSGVMTRKIEAQIQGLQNKVDDIAASLSPAGGPVEAGESIARGLDGFKKGFQQTQRQLYDALDDYLPSNTPITVNRTGEALRNLNADIDGAPALSAMFRNARIQGIENALRTDLSGNTGTLPYEAIKKLRTLVGRELADSSFMSDVPRDKWKALYAALSDDLGVAATAAGPEAKGAWQWANSFTRQQMQRLDDLATVMNKDGPERIFKAAMSGTNDGDTVIKRVVNALPKDNRKDLAAAVIRRLGRATAGNQNDMGDVFSPTTFLTNWNKLSPEAKKTLFGRLGKDGIEDALKNVAGAANIMKESATAMANPSGTAAQAALIGQIGGGALAAATGNFVPAAFALGVAPTAAYVGSKAMTSPRTVNKLSQMVRLNSGGSPAAVNQLFQLMKGGE